MTTVSDPTQLQSKGTTEDFKKMSETHCCILMAFSQKMFFFCLRI